jgi:hypothetical protein
MEVFQIESDENGHSNLSRCPLASVPQPVPPPEQVGHTVWLVLELPHEVWVESAMAAKIRNSRHKKTRGPGLVLLTTSCLVEDLIVGGKRSLLLRCAQHNSWSGERVAGRQ